MSDTTTARDQAVIERVERDLLSGRYFTLREQSNKSVPLGGGPINSRHWADMMGAVATFATGGDRFAATAAKILGRVNLYLTPNEAVAQVAGAIAGVVREDYYDVIEATGPEASRPSAHTHPTTLRVAIMHALLMVEVEMSAGYIGSVPGIGWALRALMEREDITVPAYLFPRLAKAEAAR